MLLVAVVLISGLMSGCGLEKTSMEKVCDLTYTIVPEREIPQEFFTVLEEKKQNPMELTFLDGTDLYLAVGYGVQETTGYSIGVEELYLTDNAICLNTTLIGPGQEEKVTEKACYPYIVVKLEAREEPVIFQ